MKTNFADKLYKSFSWFILAASMIAYLFYYSMKFNGTVQQAITNIHTFIHLIFTVFLSVVASSTAEDNGTQKGLESKEFNTADQANNKLIKKVRNRINDFRQYIKRLNAHERIILEEDYLFKIGDKKLDELTPKELKAFKKLKPIKHNIYGFNLPLFYEVSKDGEIKYDASYNSSKKKRLIKKAATGVLFGFLTVNMAFQFDRLGDAFFSLLIIASGLIINFIMYYFRPLLLLRVFIPRKVENKITLYESFEDFEKGDLHLKEVAIVEEEKEIITEEITVIEDGLVTPILSVIPNI